MRPRITLRLARSRHLQGADGGSIAMIVGTFPVFSPTNYGGIEESAWVASQALQSMKGGAAKDGPQFFCYGPKNPEEPRRSERILRTRRAARERCGRS